MKGNPEIAQALAKRVQELAEARVRAHPRITYEAIQRNTGDQIMHSTACRILNGKVREPKTWQLDLIARAIGLRPDLAPRPLGNVALEESAAAPQPSYANPEAARLIGAAQAIGRVSALGDLAERLRGLPPQARDGFFAVCGIEPR